MAEFFDSAVTRRRVLALFAAGAAVAAGGGSLAGCGKGSSESTGTTSQDKLKDILPNYVANTSIVPDIASVIGANGAVSDPCFLSYPTNPVTTVTGSVGSGGSYVTMTPLWGSIPPSDGNKYYEAVNKALGATLKMQPGDGTSYGDNLAPLFAAEELPDWIQIPSWNITNLSFGQAVSKFADLTPYLSGSNIEKYPNLAAISQNAWACGVWNEKLYGIPCYSTGASFSGTIYYRKDLLASLGIADVSVKSIDDLFNLGKEITDSNAGRWAFGDFWDYLLQPFGIPNKWAEEDGKLIHKYESDAILEALNWVQKVVSAGYMHPDDVAGNSDGGKQRFWSGKVAITGDGTGAWNGDDSVSGSAAAPGYCRQALDLFSADGTSTPTIALGNGSSLFSYINANLSESQVKECLSIANYLAAPYGSKEWLVSNFGEEGVDYTMQSNNPVLNELGSTEVATCFQFLASPVSATTVSSGAVDVAKAYAEWQGKAVQYAYKPTFYGMNITEPSEYGSIGQTVEDTIKDVRFGRKTIDDYKSAVEAWRQSGGDALRTFYEGIRETNGTGQ